MEKQIKVWLIKAGNLTMRTYTAYHAEQEARALCLNGMNPVIEIAKTGVYSNKIYT